jgi:hypothetical protein
MFHYRPGIDFGSQFCPAAFLFVHIRHRSGVMDGESFLPWIHLYGRHCFAQRHQ